VAKLFAVDRAGNDMIFAVMMVRNEADILRVNLLHHLNLGVDQFLVVDNGSTDGTDEVLQELSATGRVHWRRRDGRFDQAATTTELAREAFLGGARWVLPTDADEFWWAADGNFREILDASSAGALEVEVVNFIQRRHQDLAEPLALLTMTRRVPEPIGSVEDGPDLVESGRIAFVEMRYPPKYISRASIVLSIAQGNHSVSGIDGSVEKTGALFCLHAPLRARSILGWRKVEHGRRVEEINQYLRQAWHVRRWRRLSKEGRLDEEWAANSYRDDCLDVYGTKHPVAVDMRLHDVLAPWLDRNVAADRVAQTAPAEPFSPLSEVVETNWHEDGDPAETAAILARMRRVEGWLRDDEAELLIRVTRLALKEQATPTVVEIGSYCGKSTLVLAAAAKSTCSVARVYAIDPHEGDVGAADSAAGVTSHTPTFESFSANISAAGLTDVVEPIRRRSLDVSWKGPIALLFIDGLHDYFSVSRDFAHFERWLPTGAYVAFHDCDNSYPGVQACVEEIVALGHYREAWRAQSLVVLQKSPRSASRSPLAEPQELASLRLRAAQQGKGIAFLLREMETRDRIIREREEGIEWLRSVVANHETSIVEQERGIAWLKQQIVERDEAIEWLRTEASHGSEALKELGNLKASRAWRLVQFYRAIRRRFV
jgi:Methyltransferase domain/Glycosyl transferase family 2